MYSLIRVFIILIHFDACIFSRVIPQDPNCQDALGMESNKIPNEKITTDENGVHPGNDGYKGRLNNDQAYCTKSSDYPTEEFSDEIYLSVELGMDIYKVTALALQGHKSFSYGKAMQLWYMSNKQWIRYKHNGEKVIPLQGKKGDEIEFLVVNPFFTNNIKIQLVYSQNAKCLRLEVYGCKDSEIKEYNNCTGSKLILQENHSEMKFSQTNFVEQVRKYTAERLVFSNLYAWCLELSSKDTKSYDDEATIDMKVNYLIYGIQVKGFKKTGEDNSNEFRASMFTFQYSADGKKKIDLEGKKEMSTSNFLTEKTLSVPLIARYVYIRMSLDPGGNLTCIKLELYGCKAILAPDIIPTTASIDPSITTNPTSAAPIYPARILHYQIQQGNQYAPGLNWIDTEYDGRIVGTNELTEGKGCLTDDKYKSDINPFTSKCWIGWNKSKVANPSISVILTRSTVVSGVYLQTYTNRSINARPIKKISVKSGTSFPLVPLGYLCSPNEFYNREPQLTKYYIDLENTKLQYLQLNLEYSDSWILVRHVSFIQGELSNAIPLSKEILNCKVPAVPSTGDATKSKLVIVIVIIVLAILLLLLLAFVIYHYRTSLHRVFQGGGDRKQILVGGPNYHKSDNHMLLGHPPNDTFSHPRSLPYTKVQYKTGDDDESHYAAVDGSNSIDSGVLSDQLIDKLNFHDRLYSGSINSDYNTPNGTLVYSIPDVQEYADPNSFKRESIVYQGSAIYAPSYENPYTATVASSMYTETGKVFFDKPSYKIFPRKQLSFKEKIGAGQFGEVHIAIATGLDDIYGSVGHYNSWGLPDTAKVAVKLLNSFDSEVENEFMKEVEVMARLKDENVVRLLGVCMEQPKLMVVEYMENGDLNQFLSERKPEMKNVRRASQIGPNVLMLEHLVHMAQQIAAGMKYLHQVGFIHRDLATRNCLVGPAYQVKIADFGMSRHVYSKQYYRVEGKAVLPIRWMAPECLYYGKFTTYSDIWAFGVTLWEIFSFAKESPYADMTDPQVIEAACDLLQNPNKPFRYLRRPESCPDDIYRLMSRCWQLYPKNRPDFLTLYREISDKCTTSEGDI